jgi:hypothetical protein
LEEAFRTCGLTRDQLDSILGSPWEETRDGLTVLPSREFVLGLSPEARQTLYAILAAFPENAVHAYPFRYKADRVDEWIDDTLSPATRALIEPLLYRRGTSVAFSDPELVVPFLSGPAEQRRLFKALSRRPAILAALYIRHGQDTREIARYWEGQGRTKSVAPLLESLARLPHGGSVDIVHLFPRLARGLLNTYPDTEGRAESRLWNCHWTALNFFRFPPNEAFATNTAAVVEALHTEYDNVDEASRFGDVMIFVDAQGEFVHSCVYLADNLVYTKNGAGWQKPWLIMAFDDLSSLYSSVVPVTVRVYRPKTGKADG